MAAGARVEVGVDARACAEDGSKDDLPLGIMSWEALPSDGNEPSSSGPGRCRVPVGKRARGTDTCDEGFR